METDKRDLRMVMFIEETIKIIVLMVLELIVGEVGQLIKEVSKMA
jgi:hypothetical protein